MANYAASLIYLNKMKIQNFEIIKNKVKIVSDNCILMNRSL